VLLHGYMGAAEDWNAVASGLTTERRCIAVDLPAHGEAAFTTFYDCLPAVYRAPPLPVTICLYESPGAWC